MPNKRICWTNDDIDSKIELVQNGKDLFTVVYGKQIESGLDYRGAALELGRSIMHALACVGRLDNRDKNER